MVRDEFAVHKLNDAGLARAEGLAGDFSNLLNLIESAGVTGRELALTKTKLEEACFFAKRGLALRPENQA